MGVPKRRVSHAQFVDVDGVRMLEIPRTAGHTALTIDHQQVPALMVFGRVVQTVGCQLFPAKRAIFQVDLAAQLLHLALDGPQQVTHPDG